MIESIEILKQRLEKEKEKKAKAEANIKKIEEKIEQVNLSAIKATMKEYNLTVPELIEIMKKNKVINSEIFESQDT